MSSLVSQAAIEITDWSDEQSEILDFLRGGKGSCFITGDAGTGKSTTVNAFLEELRKADRASEHYDLHGEQFAIVAPTGIAALNVGGSTIHSFFTLPPQYVDVWEAQNYLRASTAERIQACKTLLIDEISMVRADVFAVMDRMCQLAKGRPGVPFGGIRVILVGDIMQLPPVVKHGEERDAMKKLGSPNGWFFKTESFENLAPRVFQLTKSFRQKDPTFYAMLNRVRNGDRRVPLELNKIVRRAQQAPEGTLQLSCTNMNVDMVNDREFNKLSGEKATYLGTIIDKFNEKNCPVPKELHLGIGARVMTIKNGSGYVNGSLGTVIALGDTSVSIQLDTGLQVDVLETQWEQIKYESVKGTLTKIVEGTFKQLPVKLAWAMTIHKSQGQSLDSAVIDFGNRTFAHGQAYVALSRLRSLEGMYFTRLMQPNDIIIDPEVVEFLEEKKSPKKSTVTKPAQKKRPMIQKED